MDAARVQESLGKTLLPSTAPVMQKLGTAVVSLLAGVSAFSINGHMAVANIAQNHSLRRVGEKVTENMKVQVETDEGFRGTNEDVGRLCQRLQNRRL